MARFSNYGYSKDHNLGRKRPVMTSFNPKVIPILSWDIIESMSLVDLKWVARLDSSVYGLDKLPISQASRL